MAITQETYGKIRRLYIKENLSIRKISKVLNISRKTVRKYCKGEKTPEERINYPEQTSKLMKALSAKILELIDKNKYIHGKQKYTAKHVHADLKKEGFKVGESTIRKFVKRLKDSHPEVFIPRAHEPGEYMEVDWGDIYAYINGVKTKVSVFCAVLPFSFKIYCVPLPTKAYDSFFLGHVKSFNFFDGIPEKCLYDNLKTAVFKGSGKNAIVQKKFKFFESHYCFESVFCNAAKGNEKGSTENLVGIIRKIAFTPIPRVKSFDELTTYVHNKCAVYCDEHKLRERHLSIKEAFEIEKKHLMPLPFAEFDCSKTLQVLVYKDLTFRFETNKYSIFPEYIGREITIKATPLKIHVYDNGNVIFTHNRTYKKNDPQYIPEHYLDIIERKPRSIANAAPLKIGVVPDEIAEFRKLNKQKDKNLELIEILKLGLEIDKEKLLKAVDMANKSGLPTLSLVKFYLQIEESEPVKISSAVDIEKTDYSAYAQLSEDDLDTSNINYTSCNDQINAEEV